MAMERSDVGLPPSSMFRQVALLLEKPKVRSEFFSIPFRGGSAVTTLGHLTIYRYLPRASIEFRAARRLGVSPMGQSDATIIAAMAELEKDIILETSRGWA
jgi:hypothetical protein